MDTVKHPEPHAKRHWYRFSWRVAVLGFTGAQIFEAHSLDEATKKFWETVGRSYGQYSRTITRISLQCEAPTRTGACQRFTTEVNKAGQPRCSSHKAKGV